MKILGGPEVLESYVFVVRSRKAPQFVSGLPEKVNLDGSTDRYSTALDG